METPHLDPLGVTKNPYTDVKPALLPALAELRYLIHAIWLPILAHHFDTDQSDIVSRLHGTSAWSNVISTRTWPMLETHVGDGRHATQSRSQLRDNERGADVCNLMRSRAATRDPCLTSGATAGFTAQSQSLLHQCLCCLGSTPTLPGTAKVPRVAVYS